jgi:hypothetical protein
MTVDPPAQVAAILGLFRALAGEIVVAVDDRVPTTTLCPLLDVADRVVRYRFRPPVDRPRAWLMAQCSGEWVLTVDGDEVPSAGLLAAVPSMLDDDGAMQHHLPRRWLFPTPDTWLAELPWWPDYQLRLVRNGPTVVARSGVHGGLVPTSPARHADADASLYHLDCLVTTGQERTDKAERYESVRPGHQAFGGGSLNHVLYLPERTHTAEPVPVPEADRALIDQVLAARHAPAPEMLTLVEVPLIADAEVDAHAAPPAGEALPEGDYRVRIEPIDHADRRMAPGERTLFYVRVANEGGTACWPWGFDQEPQIRVAYHWRRAVDGEMVHYEGIRSPLPVRVGPGEATVVPLWVDAPDVPGEYLLDVDLVHELVRWFDAPLTVEVTVAERAAAPSLIGGSPC